MRKHTYIFLLLLFFAISNIYAQEIKNNKKPVLAIPISTSWADTHGVLLSTGISAGFHISNQLLIGPEVNYSMNGKAYQSVNLGAFVRYYITEKPNSLFAELKYLQGIGRRHYIDGLTGKSYGVEYFNLSYTYLGCGFKYENKKGKLREVFLGTENDNRSDFLTIVEYKAGFRFYLKKKSK